MAQVTWQHDDGVKALNFFSISSDGRVTLWTLSKNELQYNDVMLLKLTGLVSADQEEQVPHVWCGRHVGVALGGHVLGWYVGILMCGVCWYVGMWGRMDMPAVVAALMM